jgi:protoheme IX farnesyltransferase
MATEPILAALDVAVQYPRSVIRSSVLSDYWALTKPEINFLIAFTTAAGFWMGAPVPVSHFPWASLCHTILGTVLVSSGAATLNQLIESRFDAQMRRTARRPLASGRIELFSALWFGISLSVFGAVYLALATTPLASLLSILTLLGYLFVYTPLKRKTPLCTLVGAVPGAAPPLIGWAAAGGRLTVDAWLLFAIVFLWQFPHFMSIAWMYREDYRRAGYIVLPAGDRKDHFVVWQCLLPALSLFVAAIVPGAVVAGGLFLFYSARFALQRSVASARQLLLASIVYLPVLFALLALDKK